MCLRRLKHKASPYCVRNIWGLTGSPDWSSWFPSYDEKITYWPINYFYVIVMRTQTIFSAVILNNQMCHFCIQMRTEYKGTWTLTAWHNNCSSGFILHNNKNLGQMMTALLFFFNRACAVPSSPQWVPLKSPVNTRVGHFVTNKLITREISTACTGQLF